MSEFFMTNRLLGVDVSVRAISVIVLICVLFSVVIQSAEAVQTVAQRVAQQEEPFIDTSEWVQSTSPFGDAYDQNFITETIVRGYRGADSERSISPNYRDEAIEFSKESKIQPIHYASSPTKPAAAQGNLTTQVNFNSSEQASIRPIPDATINAGDNHAQANPQFADTRNLSTNSYGQGYAPPGLASQASYVQPSYAQPFYPQGSYNQTQNYFASNVTSSNPSPYQISSAYGGYPVNYLPTNYANQPNSQQYQAPPIDVYFDANQLLRSGLPTDTVHHTQRQSKSKCPADLSAIWRFQLWIWRDTTAPANDMGTSHSAPLDAVRHLPWTRHHWTTSRLCRWRASAKLRPIYLSLIWKS